MCTVSVPPHSHGAFATADSACTDTVGSRHRPSARPLPGIGYAADPAASSGVPVYAAPDGNIGANYATTLTTASTPDTILRTVGSGASATVFAVPMCVGAPNADYASTLTTADASTTGGGRADSGSVITTVGTGDAAVDYNSVLTVADRDTSADYASVITTADDGGVDYHSVLTEAPVCCACHAQTYLLRSEQTS